MDSFRRMRNGIKMKAAYDACEQAGIAAPPEVYQFFDDVEPDPAGVEVDIEDIVRRVSPHDMADGYEIDLVELAQKYPHVKTVRFVNSY